jgi:hypothetical protein
MTGAGERTAQLGLGAGSGPRSRVGARLDDAPPEEPFEVALGVEPKRLEPSELPLLRRAPEQLEEIGQAGGSSLSAGSVRWST